MGIRRQGFCLVMQQLDDVRLRPKPSTALRQHFPSTIGGSLRSTDRYDRRLRKAMTLRSCGTCAAAWSVARPIWPDIGTTLSRGGAVCGVG